MQILGQEINENMLPSAQRKMNPQRRFQAMQDTINNALAQANTQQPVQMGLNSMEQKSNQWS